MGREGSASPSSDGSGVAGAADIVFVQRHGATRLAHLYQSQPLRVLFPQAEPGDAAALAVLVTTSGGLVAGDRIAVSARAGAGAVAHVTASAAEKIYRSAGAATTRISQALAVEKGGWLEYLPVETILFDGARLRRQTTVDVTGSGGFLGGGIIVFGRGARGERFTRGLLHEQVEVRRDGALVWGDALHLEGDIVALMAHPACFDNAAACATLMTIPPGNADAGAFLDGARAVLDESSGQGLRAGATIVNGVLVVRWLAMEPLSLRRAFADLACHLREAAMGLPPRLPRLWHV